LHDDRQRLHGVRIFAGRKAGRSAPDPAVRDDLDGARCCHECEITRTAPAAPRGANMLRMQAGAEPAQSAICYENLWLEGRWLHNATVRVDADGNVAGVSPDTQGATAVVPGLTVPGLVDAHCHAFQRALGAWTQRAAGAHDDFWSWRETMY